MVTRRGTRRARDDAEGAAAGAAPGAGLNGGENGANGTDGAGAALRQLPAVDDLLRVPEVRALVAATPPTPHAALVRAARVVLAAARAAIRAGEGAPERAALVARIVAAVATDRQPALRPVINATGVIVNTNLGRAPLSEAALAAIAQVAAGYSNLEYDLEQGVRGSRTAHVAELVRALTGAEDALVVNNNAGAVLVVLSALAAGREVIVSRGELVEIGGGFRVPDVLRQGGARLVEVGTTNRTRMGDYAAAIGPDTAALLAVHPSNFRVVGFTEAPARPELAALAHAHQLPLVEDLGSGCLLATEPFGLAHEPTPAESLAAGVDVVCFSGDKLLGGPQSGIIAGRADLLRQIARHPLMRALRSDKLTLAALIATLGAYRDGTAADSIPIWRMIAAPLDGLRARAAAWAAHLAGADLSARVIAGESTIGGGSLPGETLPTALCALELAPRLGEIAALAAALRAGQPPVVARVARAQLLLDPRTVAPEQDETLLAAVRAAAGVGAERP
jgi:L-seryl-tRNA(Ser) seleniumtransferase